MAKKKSSKEQGIPTRSIVEEPEVIKTKVTYETQTGGPFGKVRIKLSSGGEWSDWIWQNAIDKTFKGMVK